MVKTKIENLLNLLTEAKKNGCTKVKLQLYEEWSAVEKEQKNPSHPLEEYQIDSRFYNTVEFETQIENMQASEKLLSKIEGDTLIIRVCLSDVESLMQNMGLEEFYSC